jgi:hypothetical protein
MSNFVMLMIGGWTSAMAIIGLFALVESGSLLQIRKRMAAWLETSAAPLAMPEENLQPGNEDLA